MYRKNISMDSINRFHIQTTTSMLNIVLQLMCCILEKKVTLANTCNIQKHNLREQITPDKEKETDMASVYLKSSPSQKAFI